jgi:hypothetical protein
VVIDEAHHLEDVATESLTRSITKHTITYWLSRLRPMLLRAGSALRRTPTGADLQKKIDTAAEELKNAAEGFFSSLEGLLTKENPVANGVQARCLKGEAAHPIMDTQAGSRYFMLVRGLGTLLGMCRELVEQTEGWGKTWVQEVTLWVKEGQEILDTLV